MEEFCCAKGCGPTHLRKSDLQNSQYTLKLYIEDVGRFSKIKKDRELWNQDKHDRISSSHVINSTYGNIICK